LRPGTGRKLQRAGEHFGAAVKNAGDVALDAAEKAGDKVEEWTDQGVPDSKDAKDERANKARQKPPSESTDDPR